MNSYHKGLGKETIYFTFRLEIGITNFNNMGECAPVTKHERQRKLNHNPPSEKESKKTKGNCTVSALDISYITYSKKYV